MEETPTINLSKPEPVPDAEAKSPKAPKAPKPSLLLTKIETPPVLAPPLGSDHVVALPVVDAGVLVEKSDVAKQPVDVQGPQVQEGGAAETQKVPGTQGVPTHLTIETEPAVHFTPYDTVFQDTSGQSTIEYAPKVSVEDKPPSTWGLTDQGGLDDDDLAPTLTIHESSSTIGGDEVEDLEAPPKSIVEEDTSADIDAPLASTTDFEELS